MNNQKVVTFLSSITPDSSNKNGPSGLPWEIIEELKVLGWLVNFQYIVMPEMGLRRRLMQLGCPLFAHGSTLTIKTESDLYIVYPLTLAGIIPKKLRCRTILIGPDSLSFLYARFARIQTGINRIRSSILSKWFAFLEAWAANNFLSVLLVGRNDVRWLCFHSNYINNNKVSYLPHPILRSVIRTQNISDASECSRIVFSGDLSHKYVGNFFEQLNYQAISEIICSSDCEFLVVGKNNWHVYESLALHLPVKYIPWVEDYSSLCNPFRDIHVIPLFAGAGTKNRVLTALAMNLVVISTPIGLENISTRLLKSSPVYKINSAGEFKYALENALQEIIRRKTGNCVPDTLVVDDVMSNFRLALSDATNSK